VRRVRDSKRYNLDVAINLIRVGLGRGNVEVLSKILWVAIWFECDNEDPGSAIDE